MERQRRAEYLRALGIDVWVPRQARLESPPVVAPMVPAPAPQVAVSPAPPVREAPPAPIAPTPGRPPVPAAAREEAPVRLPPSAVTAATGVPVDRDWAALRAEVLGCTKCALHERRTQGVFGVGNPTARWMVIGEAPGEEEDLRGEPFVGRAGQLLDLMLRAIGLSRDSNVYIANVLKSRPPGNRDPTPAEVAQCLPYLRRQITLVKPKLLLAVGRVAATNLLGTDLSLARMRGKVHHFGELNTPLIVTYHPSYLLRTPADKRKAWEDLKFARSHFRQLTNGDT